LMPSSAAAVTGCDPGRTDDNVWYTMGSQSNTANINWIRLTIEINAVHVEPGDSNIFGVWIGNEYHYPYTEVYNRDGTGNALLIYHFDPDGDRYIEGVITDYTGFTRYYLLIEDAEQYGLSLTFEIAYTLTFGGIGSYFLKINGTQVASWGSGFLDWAPDWMGFAGVVDSNGSQIFGRASDPMNNGVSFSRAGQYLLWAADQPWWDQMGSKSIITTGNGYHAIYDVNCP